ncbi:MAG TPA: TIGR00153 family protein, partial [Myxococcota bacterium]
LFEDMAAGRTDRLADHRRSIDKLEHEADAIKHQIRSHLPKRLFMAVERRDMLEILDYQDSIADVAQDIAQIVDQRVMKIPASFAEPLLDLVRRVISACEQAERVINELDELVETGFGVRESARVEEMLIELARIESETDELAERVRRKLFAVENELGVSTVFWYELINWVADLADFAERVGNRIRLLIAS